MCASVESVLKNELDLSLGSARVNILDPCTGTGNFIVNLLRRIPKRDLTRAYQQQLFANEVMLLPYYVAALNIEHAYCELTGNYEPFEGLCFVDTLELAEGQQQSLSFMSEANTARVERQKRTPITVVIGNPPYNMGQKSETENNRNRTYKVVDDRIRTSYAKDSTATLKNELYDPYVRFFRWAVDRLGRRPGIVCFVSNNSFVDHDAFDGMQKHLLRDFTRVYHIDLHGNVNKDRTLSGTQHNVFGIQVGVGITIAVRERGTAMTVILFTTTASRSAGPGTKSSLGLRTGGTSQALSGKFSRRTSGLNLKQPAHSRHWFPLAVKKRKHRRGQRARITLKRSSRATPSVCLRPVTMWSTTSTERCSLNEWSSS